MTIYTTRYAQVDEVLPEAVLDTPESAEPPRPFVTFRDPFATGEADGMSPAELVRYSFDAMNAWAFERGHGRRPGETPLEFAERLGHLEQLIGMQRSSATELETLFVSIKARAFGDQL